MNRLLAKIKNAGVGFQEGEILNFWIEVSYEDQE